MSVLIGSGTKVIVQGITGKQGFFHGRRMLECGTAVVAGTSPRPDAPGPEGIPVYDTVRKAMAETGADASVTASVVFVPPAAAGAAIMEAAEAGIRLVVCITEGVPLHDMLKVREALSGNPVRLIGPNSPGIHVPSVCTIGIIPSGTGSPGPVGVLSRSGTLLYEAVDQMTAAGMGQSACIGLGGDPMPGTRLAEGLALFADDPGTDAVLILGEIGGSQEEEAADLIRSGFPKPVFVFVAGVSAPPGRRMGHAGAFIERGRGDARSKMKALSDAGAMVIDSPAAIGEAVRERLTAGSRP
jgi:succinyl-CoA synthetase alpha subunit